MCFSMLCIPFAQALDSLQLVDFDYGDWHIGNYDRCYTSLKVDIPV